MAGGEVSEEEEVEEAALATESPKPKEDDVAPEQAEQCKPNAGAEVVVPEPEDAGASAEDIARD